MNKDQLKGVVKDIAGKVQEEAGILFDSQELQVKGLRTQQTSFRKSPKIFGEVKQSHQGCK